MESRRTEWSFRIKQEFKQASNAHFLTLTYNNENLKIKNGMASLVRKDLTLFLKRLRKHGKFRYYGVGEYGTRTFRPHYHLIVFNCDTQTIGKLDEIWSKDKRPIGHVHVGAVSDASIHYVTKYHVNKNNVSGLQGVEPEFTTMSRNPGIGARYVDQVKKWHRSNGSLYVINDGFKQRLPRYYRDKIFSKFQKEILLAKARIDQDQKFEKEVERLYKLGYTNPEVEIELRNYYHSLKVKEKANRSARF